MTLGIVMRSHLELLLERSGAILTPPEQCEANLCPSRAPPLAHQASGDQPAMDASAHVLSCIVLVGPPIGLSGIGGPGGLGCMHLLSCTIMASERCVACSVLKSYRV